MKRIIHKIEIKFKIQDGQLAFSIPLVIKNNEYFYEMNVTVIDRLSKENSSKLLQLNILDVDFEALTDKYDFDTNRTNHFNVIT